MTFFDQSLWQGKALAGGWSPLSETSSVVNPATGERIAEVGFADAGDVDRSVARAVAAQRDWAARPAAERAAVLRRAGAALERHADILVDWLVREAGSSQGKAAFEAGLVADEAHLAAATAQMPYGQLLQSSKPRLSLARRRPVGIVAVISPFNFPAILGRALPVRRTRARQRRDPQAGSAHGGVGRAVPRRDPRGGRPSRRRAVGASRRGGGGRRARRAPRTSR